MIKEIVFGLLSPEQVRKMSVAKIVTPDTHDTDGYPIKGGLMDPRLGIVDPGLRCRTCKNKMGDCPGHFGHIELARPVIHVGYAKAIFEYLRSTCRSCGRVLLPESEIQEFSEAYEKESERAKVADAFLRASRDVKKCPHCSEKQIPIKFEKPTSYFEEKNRLTAIDVRERLERIIDDDAVLMGLDVTKARPEWMVLTVLPVPPVTMRPSITLETGERSEDDLTHKLVDILRLNQRLSENIEAGAPQLIIEDQWELVQYHVATYLDNEISGIPPARHRSGRPLKTISQRLKGKEGRFRHSLAGKRVNFSARTVIAPDPNLGIEEVGIPERIAMELTLPDRATEYNLEKLRKLVKNGPKYPGVNYAIKPDGKRKRVMDINCEEVAKELEVGWKVERHLIDGDIILFNRQPSLHRPSIMAHKVRVLPGKTFRMNLCVCAPYNADFDGDEMNVHVPQTEEARAECAMLMKVHTQLRSPRFGGPIIGCIHDHITGAYYLTRKSARFTREDALQILKYANITDELPQSTEKDKLYSGKSLFSMLLPKDLDTHFRAKWCEQHDVCKKEQCERDAYVHIKGGQLQCGIIDDRAIGAFSGQLLQALITKYGTELTAEFINKVAKISVGMAMRHGITTGLDEEDLPASVHKEVLEVIEKTENRVNELVEQYQKGTLEALPGRAVEETLEEKIMGTVNRGRDKAGRVAEAHLKETNQTAVMARLGARGNILNITQMSACLGQQAVRGQRVVRGYRSRTLPHFKSDDLGTKAHGFIRSSYKKGLDPIEFFFHAMGGRESLTDTAMRTPKSGYLQRRLINAGQDIRVEYDKTVRDNTGLIIQFRYGEDGIDPSKTEFGNINIERILGEEQ